MMSKLLIVVVLVIVVVAIMSEFSYKKYKQYEQREPKMCREACQSMPGCKTWWYDSNIGVCLINPTAYTVPTAATTKYRTLASQVTGGYKQVAGTTACQQGCKLSADGKYCVCNQIYDGYNPYDLKTGSFPYFVKMTDYVVPPISYASPWCTDTDGKIAKGCGQDLDKYLNVDQPAYVGFAMGSAWKPLNKDDKTPNPYPTSISTYLDSVAPPPAAAAATSG